MIGLETRRGQGNRLVSIDINKIKISIILASNKLQMQFIYKVGICLLVNALSTLSVVLKLSMDLFHLGVNKDS